MYEVDSKGGRPSIAPEKLLRAMLLQVFYSSARSASAWSRCGRAHWGKSVCRGNKGIQKASKAIQAASQNAKRCDIQNMKHNRENKPLQASFCACEVSISVAC